MTLEELAAELPHGLHDALLVAFSSDMNERRAELVVDVWLGDLHSGVTSDRERRRRARVELLGLVYLMVDGTHPRHATGLDLPVQVDLCAADNTPELALQVPPDGFAGRFFVTEWNASIHFAALEARLTWMAAN